MRKKYFKGFTLIELLVVISIIGILSSLAIVSLNGARMKARDALRRADMAQLRTALALYYDNNNQYPPCDAGSWDPNDLDDSDGTYLGSSVSVGSLCYNTILDTALTGSNPKPIMAKLPKDPLNPNNDDTVSIIYLYRYISTGQEYAIIYYLENGGINAVVGW